MKKFKSIFTAISFFAIWAISFAQTDMTTVEWEFDTTDSLFAKPFVDVDEWRDEHVRHRYVHGGFDGTETRFLFYFPVKEEYEGRSYQYITPVPDSETLSQGASGEEDKISFCLQNGAYFAETNGGGNLGIRADPL